ncbi:MAG: hypothetical protein DRI75_12515 [Bacteroidetes bacterium]|nr:MAG: hypothetical protein DRI75_12515 [Bacteroidota bacterium]
MKKLISIAAVLILILSLTSCYYDEVPEEPIRPPNLDVSFANNIQPIFNTHCISCHNGTLNPDLREGNSYNFLTITDPDSVVPNDADGSELYQRLIGVGNIMPPSGALSNNDVSLVRDWINQGALNN